MARYVKLEDVISYLPRYIPTADVVEQEKIDEALDETYKIRNEILQANGCYEPNDVIDIIDQITKLFEEI